MRTKILQYSNIQVNRLILMLALISFITIIPIISHNQWITGPLINALLIITFIYIGSTEAIFCGLIPSVSALIFGLLPLPLAPMIPFIMISNAIFILSIKYLSNHYWISVFFGAFLKFLFLSLTVNFFMSDFLNEKYLSNLSIMMSWPQFYTAILGGIIAWFFTKKSTVK